LEEDYDRKNLLKKDYPRWAFYQNVLRKRRALEELRYNHIEILSLLEFSRDEILHLIERIQAGTPDRESLIIIVEEKRAQLRTYCITLEPKLREYGASIDQTILDLIKEDNKVDFC
jgi:hypothetical protein